MNSSAVITIPAMASFLPLSLFIIDMMSPIIENTRPSTGNRTAVTMRITVATR